MPKLGYVKHQRLVLKNNAEFDEKWVQARIADDPKILGLGDVAMRDMERIQPKGGRLDLLLQDVDPESKTRYEVELQLGATDESHLVRTLEYWDIERRRYPQYEHVAVIIAETITGRFLNVISLFNGAIPLIAIEMSAIAFGENLALVFTTVLDKLDRGLVDDDESAVAVTDRPYWEARGCKETVKMADEMLELVKVVEPGATLKYNKFYIGLSVRNRANNFVSFVPQKTCLRVEYKLPQVPENDELFEKAGFENIGYDRTWHQYKTRLNKGEIEKYKVKIQELIEKAFHRTSA